MLHNFIDEGTIVLETEVSRKLEVTDISLKYKERPVLLTNLEGKRAFVNLWASRERIYRELRMDRQEFLKIYQDSLNDASPIKEGEKLFTEKVGMDEVPTCQFYKGDAGYYITSGIFVAEKGRKRNLSIHRVWVRNSQEGLVRLVPRDLFRMYNESVDHGEELKVSIVIGSPLEFLLASATSIPFEKDESAVANSLYRKSKGKDMTFSRSANGIMVPSHSEYVINAVFSSHKEREGPFKDVTGTYDIQENQPQIFFESVETVKDPIYHALVPATLEHFNLMGLPREPTIFNEIRKEGVNVIDVRLPEGGASWLHGVVKIQKASNDDFRKTVEASFRGHKSLKRVIVVDKDIDIYNDNDVEWALATRFQADRGIIVKNERGSSLDPSSYKDNITSKMGMDATMPLGGGRKFVRD